MEREESKEIPIEGMSYEEFLAAQQRLRDSMRPTIPFISAPYLGYQEAVELAKLVASYDLESNINTGLRGITAYIDNEENFKNLLAFIKDHPEHTFQLPR
jgi:hypothetical protein